MVNLGAEGNPKAYDWVEGRHADQYLLKKEVTSGNGCRRLCFGPPSCGLAKSVRNRLKSGYLCVLRKRKTLSRKLG